MIWLLYFFGYLCVGIGIISAWDEVGATPVDADTVMLILIAWPLILAFLSFSIGLGLALWPASHVGKLIGRAFK